MNFPDPRGESGSLLQQRRGCERAARWPDAPEPGSSAEDGYTPDESIHPSIHPCFTHIHTFSSQQKSNQTNYVLNAQHRTEQSAVSLTFCSALHTIDLLTALQKRNVKLLNGVDVIPLDVFTFCLMNHPQKQAVWSHDPEAVTGFNPDYIFSRSSANV